MIGWHCVYVWDFPFRLSLASIETTSRKLFEPAPKGGWQWTSTVDADVTGEGSTTHAGEGVVTGEGEHLGERLRDRGGSRRGSNPSRPG